LVYAGDAAVDIGRLETAGKLILGLIFMLLFLLPTGTVTKLLRAVRDVFRTPN
jgi:hypothetical protein